MSDPKLEVRPYTSVDRTACEAVFATLPDWFGLPESNEAYLADLARLPAWVALRDGRVVGFTSLRFHSPESAELEVLAVERDLHRCGIGRRLVAQLDTELARRGGVKLFHVKTRGSRQPDEGYEKTRRFYEALDFVALFETDALWGAENPALIMVRLV